MALSLHNCLNYYQFGEGGGGAERTSDPERIISMVGVSLSANFEKLIKILK